MTFGETEMSNDLGLPLTKIVLLLASLAAHRRATSSLTPIALGVRRHTSPGIPIHLADRRRGTTTHVHLAVIGRRPMIPVDKIVRHRHPIAKIPAIIAAHTQPKSGSHGWKIKRPTATISHHLCQYRRWHQRNAHASAISAVTVTAHENEVETEGVETAKKGAGLGPHRIANPVPNLALGRRLLHLLLTATLITRTYRISSTSFWA